ncbi:hypothetical protein [Segetibacter sp. 3557_3]|uniref:hypothetical protein n=1 Tax=Segetibacter sp. 3557_3 TaxID=2547429 RepID=UPI0014051F66|nr:hypothetical protein [Segetibacter sp. 3557_3]
MKLQIWEAGTDSSPSWYQVHGRRLTGDVETLKVRWAPITPVLYKYDLTVYDYV